MPLLTDPERELAEALATLSYANPFLPERIEAERLALGSAFVDDGPVWYRRPGDLLARPNVERLSTLATEWIERIRKRRLEGGSRAGSPSKHEIEIYEDVAIYHLFHLVDEAMLQSIRESSSSRDAPRFPIFTTFADEYARLFDFPEHRRPDLPDPAHLFACLYQVRRAFHWIFTGFIGASRPAFRLRAAVWQSVFTHDMRRYRRVLFGRMGDMTTLVTGPSGSGKDLVARAIGFARYVPFDPETRRFAEDVTKSFAALDLSAMSPTLIESELFGHARGAFTGAVGERVGWLETCPERGTVFLDEIGELEESIQVKLLRVLESRTFSRLGETATRRFEGKIVAATNRDLTAAISEGRFRMDLYFRLCSDMIVTPSLAERAADRPEELRDLVRFLAARMVGDDEAPALAREVLAWIDRNLGADYTWPGNVRELDQCARNILVRGEYHPPSVRATSARDRFAAEMLEGELAAEELLQRYCTLVYAQAGSYEEAGRRLGLDRRTVKAKIDRERLESLRHPT